MKPKGFTEEERQPEVILEKKGCNRKVGLIPKAANLQHAEAHSSQ